MGHIRRLIGYSLRHKRILFGFLLFAGIGAIFNLIAPLIMIHIIDNVILADNLDQLMPNILVYVSLGVGYALFDTVGRYWAAISSQRVIYDLRKDIYESFMGKDLAFYDENETGQLLARATTDVSTMREFLYWGVRVVFIGLAMLIGTFIVMYTVSPELTVYMFMLIPIFIGFIYVFAKKVRPVFYAARKQYGVLSSVLAENIVGHKVIRSYAQEDKEKERVEEENRGFDLISRRPHPEDPDTAIEVRFIEVKGRSQVGEVALTTNEYKTAERLQQDFWLYVVFNCATEPDLHVIRDPARLGWEPIVKVEHYHVGANEILKSEIQNG